MQSLLLILRDRRYFAPVWLFASLNIIIGTWVLYLPTVKENLALNDSQLGLAIFCFSFGLLSIIPVSAALLRIIGLGRLSLISICGFAAMMCLPILMPSYLSLCIVLFGCGIFSSLTDIGMNAMVSELEQEDGVHFMSAAHGFFSLGGVIGAGIGSLLIGTLSVPLHHFLLAAGFVILTNLFLARSYSGKMSTAGDRGESGKFRFDLVRSLIGLAVLSVIIMGSEGAIEHWSKLYLLDIVNVSSDQLAGIGFVLFSTAMTVGRFLGDGISTRFGPLNIIIGGTLLAAAGFGLVLTAGLWPAMVGFTLVGFGFSVIIPELFRLAGKAEGVSAAEGISVVAGLGYAGFLASPALLGFLSNWSSLKLSFMVLLAGSLIAAGIGLTLRMRARTRVQRDG